MKKPVEVLEIFAVGLDSETIESIKTSLHENDVRYRISFVQTIDELRSYNKRNAHAVFFYSNRQSQKTIDDIRKIHLLMPGAGVTLLSPRAEHSGIVNGFRAGLFDFLTIPIDQNEIRTVIYRLKIHGAVQGSQWNPERAVLHLFSRPESFVKMNDVAAALNEYLSLFFKIEEETDFSTHEDQLEQLKKRLSFSEIQFKKVKTFLSDKTGLVFGIKFFRNECIFLIKTSEDKVRYTVAINTSEYLIRDILSNYLANILKTTLTILEESKEREHIRMLSLTDEVTGAFNQRKLVEDLDHYIGRFQHDNVGFSLLFIDIDYFKNVNDQFGHVVGSQLLIDMANILRHQLRSTDLIYRYGGDEFIVLLPRTNIEETKKIALRISDAVKIEEFKIASGQKYRLSLSIGVAQYPTDATSAKSIIEFADKMMYMSKKSGRGKVFHVTEVVA